MAKGIRAGWRITGPTRARTLAARVLLAVALAITALVLLAFFAAVRDDYAIDKRTGHAVAEVTDVGYLRTIVRFVTPDGQLHVPVTGVLYPRRLHDGDRVRVEYDKANPDLVRVAGRNWRLGLLPAGTTLAWTWAIAGVGTWLLVRRPRGNTEPEPSEQGSTESGAQPPAEQLVGDPRRRDE